MAAIRAILARIAARILTFVARAITAVQPLWVGIDPDAPRQRVYFANHASHGDFILIWSVLPPRLQRLTRPVAGADYWQRGALRRFIGCEVFGALLIRRQAEGAGPLPPDGRDDPEAPIPRMAAALDEGSSLILFPEGTRNQGDAPLLPFRSGLYHLARARPQVDLVPVWIENLNRVLPKGAVVPVPLMCKVVFGAPLHLAAGEDKAAFLARARAALLALRPRQDAQVAP
ncbi:MULTISPECIES: lysophospholipid acyltransferase family protein [unclassified Paracoccus (in: a-proteobacteria)]|uniref:lysophospholipid acyltransferase family protein n=1 Tax=unclassified Paracoccus (in: a-proteobacteria) TaxID=2688777 RepID=UPI0021E132B7|nr:MULTISPECIES: lysophospholipid acyltransferase family protein [unclassified Paracoccus (in: a-proteobacteria)]UXU76631.1 1-acyl-sn-glycerol-3-phosphate acyltransferase [Paracoccus sp. SMMA_5]UXU82519.1 1-acyl-sn-glycerol-3-phosphate acyltransferase [Paracoccus sp. SMMA_5_TC]